MMTPAKRPGLGCLFHSPHCSSLGIETSGSFTSPSSSGPVPDTRTCTVPPSPGTLVSSHMRAQKPGVGLLSPQPSSPSAVEQRSLTLALLPLLHSGPLPCPIHPQFGLQKSPGEPGVPILSTIFSSVCQVLFKDERTLDLQGETARRRDLSWGVQFLHKLREEQVLGPAAVTGAGLSALSPSALAIWVGRLKSLPP